MPKTKTNSVNKQSDLYIGVDGGVDNGDNDDDQFGETHFDINELKKKKKKKKNNGNNATKNVLRLINLVLLSFAFPFISLRLFFCSVHLEYNLYLKRGGNEF